MTLLYLLTRFINSMWETFFFSSVLHNVISGNDDLINITEHLVNAYYSIC